MPRLETGVQAQLANFIALGVTMAHDPGALKNGIPSSIADSRKGPGIEAGEPLDCYQKLRSRHQDPNQLTATACLDSPPVPLRLQA
jgi:hypothetical protein